jgi:hypothetical protein
MGTMGPKNEPPPGAGEKDGIGRGGSLILVLPVLLYRRLGRLKRFGPVCCWSDAALGKRSAEIIDEIDRLCAYGHLSVAGVLRAGDDT